MQVLFEAQNEDSGVHEIPSQGALSSLPPGAVAQGQRLVAAAGGRATTVSPAATHPQLPA